MTLEDKILTTKPREESGSKTSRKYQFQKDQSLFMLIEEHENRDDYLFLFDFHEDLVIANSAKSPNELEFYQIKSKDTQGNWTINKLTKAPQDKLSILGKLYLNRITFGESTTSLNFISNANFGFKKLKNGYETVKMVLINAGDMNNDDFKSCEESIKAEHKLTEKTEFERLMKFQVTNLSNSESSTHCIGALSRLINKINPSNSINPELAYNQVLNEITRKTNAVIGDKSFQTADEIFELKGISKSQFLSFLDKAGLYKSVEDEWQEVKTSLETCGIDYIELLKFKSSWREMNGRIIKDSNSIPLRRLVNSIEDYYVNKVKENELKGLNLLQIIDFIHNEIESNNFNEYLVKCLIIRTINES